MISTGCLFLVRADSSMAIFRPATALGPGRDPGPCSRAAAGLHSYLQKSLSPLGRWSPSMAKRCTTLLWITRRHRVCRDGTVGRRWSKAT